MLNPVNDSSANQDSSSPQTPRTDLQTTNQQQTTADLEQAAKVTQDQMQVNGLRVGSTTVQNSTSTPSNTILGHDLLNPAWLWLLVPLVMAIILFKPQKKSTATATSGQAITPAVPVVAPLKRDEPAVEAAKPAVTKTDTPEAKTEAQVSPEATAAEVNAPKEKTATKKSETKKTKKKSKKK